ncbi:hypothetical protein BKA70DRAFT_1394677 [Coprinopsis sp. MPI-PUGE-AT-0042]|nr:hypothetical protein BKA70DRAFT_1394677 [Coprinopsis sp. MPI-PUGE-AT-0042]
MPKFKWAIPERGNILTHLDVCVQTPELAGPTVCCRAYAIPLMDEDIEEFIDKLYPDYTDLLTQEKMIGFTKEFDEFVPEGILPRIAKLLVPIKGKGIWPCIGVVIATNMTEEDRERAKVDPQLIKKLQENLGVTNAPGWFRIINSFDDL